MSTHGAAAGAGVWTNPIDGSEMVFVPAGLFGMGISPAELEKALHACKVPVPYHGNFADGVPATEPFVPGFWIGRYAVTNRQFATYLTDAPHGTPDEETAFHKDRIARAAGTAGDFPASLITWLEAADYCRWAGGRLPMEAEWEKAARGTDRRWFPWGNNVDPLRANTIETSHPFPDGVPVTKFAEWASPYGCIQMAGNISHWCADWYEPTAYAAEGWASQPRGPSYGTAKCIRGGDTTRPLVFARTSCRDYADPHLRPEFTGFRLVIDK